LLANSLSSASDTAPQPCALTGTPSEYEFLVRREQKVVVGGDGFGLSS